MLDNLIIGGSAQLAMYFPKHFVRISSRNIDYTQFKDNKYDRIYVLMAEHRTYLNKPLEFYEEINVYKTLEVVNFFKDKCNNVVLYSTSELWNNINGEINLDIPYNYNYSPYIKSKENLSTYIKKNRNNYNNIILIYPVNFNSIYRKGDFLFGKIFNSILNKEKITVGDIDFNRDVIHPSIIANESVTTNKDLLIGSGSLTNIKKYIIDLYNLNNIDYKDYIKYDQSNNLLNLRKEYFTKEKFSSYEDLLLMTKNELNNIHDINL
jgi:hypothetical protein